MGKYIYQIINDINNKQYIGQTINPKKRFTQHCTRSDDTLIHRAIVKYGKSHFHLNILGYFENYNEMEKYYIKEYNTLVPNGYNILSGGEEPPTLKGSDNPSAIITEEVAKNIQKDLLNFNIPRRTILKKYGVSANIVRHINEGSSWNDKKYVYPLRPSESKIIEQKVEEVKKLLKETSLTQKKIAEKVGFKRSFVTMINIGKNHYDPNEKYPIRERKINIPLNEIIKMLQTTNIPMNKIAEQVQVKKEIVYNINSGKTYYNNKIKYPIRK